MNQRILLILMMFLQIVCYSNFICNSPRLFSAFFRKKIGIKFVPIIFLFLPFAFVSAQGSLLIFSAIESGDLPRLKESIQVGADYQSPNSEGLSPILLAIQRNNKPIINYLLTLPLQIDLQDKEGNNVLHFLSSIEDESLLKQIFTKDGIKNAIQNKNKEGLSPLWMAIESVNELYVNLLLKNGADPNEFNLESKPILLLAHEKQLSLKSSKTKNIFLSIIQSGANVNIRTTNLISESGDQKKSLLQEITEIGEKDLCKLLIDKGANFKEKIEGNTLLHIAAKKGKEPLVSLYLNHALRIDEKGENGNTPLFVAVKERNEPIIKLLMEKGANVNLGNFHGDTPLSLSVKQGNLSLMNLLIQNGADILHVNELGNTLLMEVCGSSFANRKDQNKMISIFIQSGIQINAKNIYGNSALSYALNTRNTHLIKTLLKLGGDVNLSDSNGNTLIHKTVLLALFERLKNKDLEEILDILLGSGANPNLKNNDGYTPLHIAIKPAKEKDEKGSVQVVQKLLDYSADPNMEDKLGATAFDYGKGSILKLLRTSGGNSNSLEEFSEIANSSGKDLSLGLDFEPSGFFHLGDYDTKKIASKFTKEGKLEKQVLTENAFFQYLNPGDGVYLLGLTPSIQNPKVCKLVVQKLNFNLQEYWVYPLEENVNCQTTLPLNLVGNRKDSIFVHYSISKKNKIVKINPETGKNISEVQIDESIYDANFIQDKVYFLSKKGVYVYTLDLKLIESKLWSEKKNLIVTFTDTHIYSIVPNVSKPGFSITKSNLKYQQIWRKKYSSLKEDIPKYILVKGSQILIAGETMGNLHGNQNRGKSSFDIFLIKMDTDGNRMDTQLFGTSKNDTLGGIFLSADNIVYIHGNSSEKIIGKPNQGKEDIFILKVK
jgi:ankyrin repeat protein